MALDSAFWRDRRVFVTGHTGFKGSWLSLWLQRLGAVTTGYSVGVPTSPSMFELAEVATGMQSIEGDVRDMSSLTTAMQLAQTDTVIHLAAQATVLRGDEATTETYETNVLGTVNLLEAIRRTPSVRSALIVTSDKCYREDDGASGPHREDDPLGGRDPYSSSKACAEHVVEAYRASYFSQVPATSVATARAGNVFGGGDWSPNRILPDMVRAFQSGTPARIRNPRHVRPWQHVLEPLYGYLMLCEHLGKRGRAFAEAWNFGPAPREVVPVRALADRVAVLWGDGASWQHMSTALPAESTELVLDSGKATTRLGWRPRLDLETGLRWTVDWYKGVASGSPARDVSSKQIDDYSNSLES
jgi:CDP-glucose 4,6-dehydratase